MFFGFWTWLLIAIIVICIFFAGHLPDARKIFEEKIKQGFEAAKKGKQDLAVKLSEAKKKKDAEAAKKKTETKDFEKEEDE